MMQYLQNDYYPFSSSFLLSHSIFLGGQIHSGKCSRGPELCAQSLSCVRLFVSPWTVAHLALLAMGILGKNTRAGCHTLLQGIFQPRESNPGLLYCRWILYRLSHQGSPRILGQVDYPFSRGSSQGLLPCRWIHSLPAKLTGKCKS